MVASREEAVREAKRRSAGRAGGRFAYVNRAEAERLGLTEWKAEPGDNFLYVAPAIDEETGQFTREIHVHRNVGPDGLIFLCPMRMKKQPCPICEEMVRLRKEEADPERIKALRPVLRFLFFVVDVKSEDTERKGLRYYDAPSVVYDEILGLSVKKRTQEFVDLTDPRNRMSLTFTRVGSGRNTKYKSFEVEEYPGGDIPESWYRDVPSFESILKYEPYEVIDEAFSGIINESSGDSSDDSDDGSDNEGSGSNSRDERSFRSRSDSHRSRDHDDDDVDVEREESDIEDRVRSRVRESSERTEERESRSKEPEERRGRSRERSVEEPEKSSRRSSGNDDVEREESTPPRRSFRR